MITTHTRPLTLAEQWAAMDEAEREAFIAGLSESEAEALLYEWEIFARPEQLPPDHGEWFGYMPLAGRGWGKTRTGAEWVRKRVRQGYRYIALVGETAADVRDVMIQGESGLLAISPKHERPVYQPSKRRLEWANGAVAICFSGKEPDQLRGPQHDTAWCDEIAKWAYAEEAWTNLEMGMRLTPFKGARPQVMITTTPRPIKIIKELAADPMIITVQGSSYDNISNLADTFIKRVIRKYEGTRAGLQELHAKILDNVAGALWTPELIDQHRVTPSQLPPFKRVALGIDPAMRKRKGAAKGRDLMNKMTQEKVPNETGLVVVAKGVDRKRYVLEDASGEYSPAEWGEVAVELTRKWNVGVISVERNQGGDLVASNLEEAFRTAKRRMPRVRDVWSSVGKGARAEPVAGDTERGEMKFVGHFAALEDQMTSTTVEAYLGAGSPDRLDAMVNAATELAGRTTTSASPDDYETVQM